MHYFLLLLAASVGAYAENPSYCPLLGPVYPPPTSLSEHVDFLSATKEIVLYLEASAEAGNLSDSISLQIFSGRDEASLFRYSYTTPTTQNATLGVQEVNENTVFRIGSGSKLWTVLMLMMQTHGRIWNEPIAKYVPRLGVAANDARHNSTQLEDQIGFAQWGEVTVGELASHSAGIMRDCMCTEPLRNLPRGANKSAVRWLLRHGE